MPPDSLVVAAPVVLVAYVVFGMTGFGAAMVAVPVLVQFMPLQFAVPLVVLFDLACTALVGGSNWRRVSLVELKRLFPWLLLGIGLGVTLLHNAGARWPLILLGSFVLAVCIKGLRGARATTTAPLNTFWALPFGVFGGIFSALFGTGGPIYTIYLSRRLDALDQFRATISVVILASGLIRAAAFGAAGLYAQPEILSAAAVLLPVALVGLYGGSRLRTRVSPELLKRAIFLLLAIAGAGAIYRGWVSPP
ncbi:sulfite exporter TauE/SafE family protein [Achromobacter sp. SD115]|uniref:sulfite exporter TauE/SafE family protein n=1 Tax=Achromobacter sp. SD115 TaxID=2782011 RepID=UPI001A977441|nr:sulfite exporter TauE/SafE family protein [Achromobacter sp. SD115]MBO1016357.1 sulfite exporter TauE/SafE family protein [Achromobacter sp. SD115]